MIQLAFDPAFDPFHAAFRFLRQAAFIGDRHLPITRSKLLDFFVAEPRRCLGIRLPPALKSAAKKAAECQVATYGHRPSAPSLFNRMSPMQDAAIQTLVIHGILDGDAFTRGFFALSENPLPPALADRVEKSNLDQFVLMDFLCNKLDNIPYDGINGLKHRTGIGEYRYDLV